MILRRDGVIERPADKLKKDRLLSEFGLLVSAFPQARDGAFRARSG